jgi:hypothetical protein
MDGGRALLVSFFLPEPSTWCLAVVGSDVWPTCVCLLPNLKWRGGKRCNYQDKNTHALSFCMDMKIDPDSHLFELPT